MVLVEKTVIVPLHCTHT